MNPDLSVTGSLSFLLDIVPVIVIAVIIIAFLIRRHKYLKEKNELMATIEEYKTCDTEDNH